MKDETIERIESRKKYFNDMVVQFNHGGGMEHLFSFLKNFELKDFNIRDFPNTAIKDDHKMAALTSKIEGFLIEKLASGELYENQDCWGFVKRTDFYKDYCAYIKLHNPNYPDPLSANIFGKELRQILPDCVKITSARVKVKDRDGFKYEIANAYSFAPIEKCRKVFCDSINVNISWEDPVKEQVSEILTTDGDIDFKDEASSDELLSVEEGKNKKFSFYENLSKEFPDSCF
jgi:hypothetical protein